MRQARPDALLDDAALELGKHAQHLKHRFPGRCPGVEALLMQEEIDASAISVRRAFARTPERRCKMRFGYSERERKSLTSPRSWGSVAAASIVRSQTLRQRELLRGTAHE
jgi:hypothetical protein